jgi:uncharacterized FAD-dependent dehydrogenase
VLLIEKGKSSRKRNCPINTYRECIRCKPCNTLSGIGGAGLFSDGQLNYIYKLGKTDLSQFMPIPQAAALIDETGQIFNCFGIEQRGIEVGVRVEVHNDMMQDLCDVVYDPTFFIQTGKYDDQTRTFCTNQGGFVTLENYSTFVCVNGHACQDRKSQNTNFAFLSKVVLTEPVTNNQAYGRVHRKPGNPDRRRQHCFGQRHRPDTGEGDYCQE